jgi:thiamine-monophosphate kinase
VTGSLGASAGGLLLSRSSKEVLAEALTAGWGRELLRAHERPPARVGEGQTLAQSGATAMMDLSDGIARDLPRLCHASDVGATIRTGAIPIAPEVKVLAERLGHDALELAISGGEDYELLVVLRPGALDEAAERLRERFGVPLTEIGETTEDGIVTVDAAGTSRPLAPRGWDHFTP